MKKNAARLAQERRLEMIASGYTLNAGQRHDADQARRGLGEEALVERVLRMKAAQRATAGN